MTNPEQASATWCAAALLPGTLIVPSGNSEPLVAVNLADGTVTFGPGYDPDEAARLFWEAIQRQYTAPEAVFGRPLHDRINAELAKGNEALAAVARVRALHQPVNGRTGWGADDDPTPGSYGDVTPACAACGSQDDAVRWPCPTIAALDGTGEA